jgi:hypothetical protein
MLQNVPGRCELKMAQFALQGVMQVKPFPLRRDRKGCKFIDEGCGLVGQYLHKGFDTLWETDGRTACNNSMSGMLDEQGSSNCLML